MKVIFLTRYAPMGASSRVRAYQFESILRREGIEPVYLPLLSNQYVRARYNGGISWSETFRGYWARVKDMMRGDAQSMLWIEKELFPSIPYEVEAALIRGRWYVLDFDDAVFHNYDLSSSALVRGVLGSKLDRLMARASVVTVGNGYLAERARQAGAARIERLPSSIDLDAYPRLDPFARLQARSLGQALRVVWIGSPATVTYLLALRAPLEQLASERPVELHVIGAEVPPWLGVTVIHVPWSKATESQDIGRCDVGVMPLADTPWEQGKCSFKLIQYMACGLPVVASPVGMNVDVVRPGHNGLLASSDGQWLEALRALAEEPELRARLGAAGRADVEATYCIQVTGPRLASILRGAAHA